MTTKKKQSKDSGLIGRRDIIKEINQAIKKGETAILLKGPSGVGKSLVLSHVCDDLKKKRYDPVMFRGITSAEMVLEQIIRKAVDRGIAEVENIFSSPVEYRDKLKQLLERFIYKEKLILVFEDFDENQDTEGKLLNPRLNELILYLKDELKEKGSFMIFCSRLEIPKFTAIEIPPFTWREFLKQISRTTVLTRLKEKSLKTFYFDMGGYPRAVQLLDIIAQHEFGTSSFEWVKLRERVPSLNERVLYKDSESADFSYLLVEALLSYLSQRQRDLLNTLSIYRGWVSGDQVKAHSLEIKPGDRKKLEKLALIEYQSRKDIYQVPRLVAHIAYKGIEEAQRKQKHLTAAKYFESLIPGVETTGQGEAAGVIYDENALNARWHYLEAGEVRKALSMTFEMDNYFCRIGFPQFAFDLLQQMEKHAADLSETQQIHLRLRLGMFYSLFGKLDDALTQHEACLKIHEAQKNTQGIALNQGQLGMIYEAKGKNEEALGKFQLSLAAYEQLGNQVEIARRLDQIGSLQKREGKYDDAFESYQRALSIHRELRNQKEIAADLEQLGRIHDEQGKFEPAMDYYHQSLAEKEALADQAGIASLVHQMGNVNFFTGKLDEAFALYQRSLKIKTEIDDLKGAGYSLGQLGLIYQRKGDNDEALSHFEKSLQHFEKAEEQKGIAASHHQIGRICESKGDVEKALTHYEKALEIREKSGDMLGAAITYGQLGMLFYQKEEYENALRYSTQAYAIFSRYGSPNAELARKNMLRIREKLPKEKFNEILNQLGIKTEAAPPPGKEDTKPEQKETNEDQQEGSKV